MNKYKMKPMTNQEESFGNQMSFIGSSYDQLLLPFSTIYDFHNSEFTSTGEKVAIGIGAYFFESFKIGTYIALGLAMSPLTPMLLSLAGLIGRLTSKGEAKIIKNKNKITLEERLEN